EGAGGACSEAPGSGGAVLASTAGSEVSGLSAPISVMRPPIFSRVCWGESDTLLLIPGVVGILQNLLAKGKHYFTNSTFRAAWARSSFRNVLKASSLCQAASRAAASGAFSHSFVMRFIVEMKARCTPSWFRNH